MSKSKVFLSKQPIVAVVALAGALLSGCGVLAPFKERQQSIDGLERAKKHEAPKYAQEQYNQAVSSHDTAESLIITNKKSSQNKAAKEAYLQAIVSSSEAYAIAIRAQIESIIKGIRAEMKSWEAMGTQKVIPEMYEQIKGMVAEVESMMADPNQYEVAYQKALEAEALVEKAKAKFDDHAQQAREFYVSLAKVFERAQKSKVHLVEREEYTKHYKVYTGSLRALLDELKFAQVNSEGTALKATMESLITRVVGMTERLKKGLDELDALKQQALNLKADRALKVEYKEAVSNLEELQSNFRQGSYKGLEGRIKAFKNTWQVIISLTKQKAEQAQKALEEARAKFNDATNRSAELDDVDDLKTNSDVKKIYDDVKEKKGEQ